MPPTDFIQDTLKLSNFGFQDASSTIARFLSDSRCDSLGFLGVYGHETKFGDLILGEQFS